MPALGATGAVLTNGHAKSFERSVGRFRIDAAMLAGEGKAMGVSTGNTRSGDGVFWRLFGLGNAARLVVLATTFAVCRAFAEDAPGGAGLFDAGAP